MSYLHSPTGAVYNVILFTNLPAIFRESQLPAGCGVDLYFFTFVRFSYDFNASSRGLIEKIHTETLRQSCGFRAGTTGFLAIVRNQCGPNPKPNAPHANARKY